MENDIIKFCIKTLLDDKGFNSDNPQMTGQQEEALCQALNIVEAYTQLKNVSLAYYESILKMNRDTLLEDDLKYLLGITHDGAGLTVLGKELKQRVIDYKSSKPFEPFHD